MFGAKGDGVASDSDAFNSALQNNDYLLIPEKMYLLDKPVVVGDGKRIIGCGKDTIIKAKYNAFNVTGRYNSISNISIMDVSDDSTENTAILNYGTSYTSNMNTYDNIVITGFSTAIKNISAWNMQYNNIRINGADVGISVEGDGGMTQTFTNLHFNHCIRDISMTGLHIGSFHGCNFGMDNANTVLIQSGSRLVFDSCNFEADSIVSPTSIQPMIYIYSGDVIFSNCRIKARGNENARTVAVSKNCNHVEFNSCTFELTDLEHNSMTLNSFWDESHSTPKFSAVKINAPMANEIGYDNLNNDVKANLDIISNKIGTLTHNDSTSSILRSVATEKNGVVHINALIDLTYVGSSVKVATLSGVRLPTGIVDFTVGGVSSGRGAINTNGDITFIGVSSAGLYAIDITY